MSHRAERMAIRCPIDLFSAQEKEIIRLTRKINQAHTVTDKEPWARALIRSTEILVGCLHYDEEATDCRLCRSFAQMRRSGADLVIRAGQLIR